MGLPIMWPSHEAVPVHATIWPVLPGYSCIRMASMAPMAAASAAPPIILKTTIFILDFKYEGQ